MYFNLKYNTSVSEKISAIFFEIMFEGTLCSSELLAIKAILSKHTPPAIPAMPQKTSLEYLSIFSKNDYLSTKWGLIDSRKVHDTHALKFHMYFVRTMECLQTMCFKLEMILLNIFDSNNCSNLDKCKVVDSSSRKCASVSIR